MSSQHAKPNEIVKLIIGNTLDRARTTTFIKTPNFELIRWILPVGKEIPIHATPGEIIVQCLEGRVAFTAMDETQELTSGHLLFLPAGQAHSVTAVEDASLLVTRLLPKSKPPEPFDVVQEASEESFPASDSPAY